MSDTVLTLIADRTKTELKPELAQQVISALGKAGAQVASQDWLSKGEALDIHLSGISPETAEAIAQGALGGARIDAIAQSSEIRKKQMLICDMDSTIITIECIDEIADFVGKKAEVALITERAMNGELDFKMALEQRVALLKGLPVATLQKVYDERLKFMPGARELVATMRTNGARTVLVSGGFTFFTNQVSKELGFALNKANLLEVDPQGLLTGRVTPPILDKEAKLQTLKEECARLGIEPEEVMAVGDGANDLPMILAAGMGVGYHGKEVVQKTARHNLRYCDLSALLFVQGYRREKFRHSPNSASAEL